MAINHRRILIAIVNNFSPAVAGILAAILEYQERQARALGDEVQEWLDWRAFLKDVEATAN